ncbi:HpcH/HpaI aldolase family protein [Paenibacillus montanisoli]|uniref:Hpch/hpai aldolase n=1 Tax=Paenibacillus montanisoli TaxID=2081970 RepID=A0A328U5T8_9BACL|nr:aldolase/citrate lyase family protein [Paenibacillus montanisoli]RAP77920.1 hpch/hpai aldolase [Paenibacillus montanisoli]
MSETLKEKMRKRMPAYGTFVFEFFESGVPLIVKQAGADFIVWDMEHSSVSLDRLKPLLTICRSEGIVPIVRVPNSERHFVSRVLDIGAQGILVPMVESVEQMISVITYAKYSPIGLRGSAFGLAHDRYEYGSVPEKMKMLNDSVILLPLIESKAGVEAAEEIAGLSEIDALWLGPLDLAHSLGIPGDYDHPLFREAVLHISRACEKAGKTFGIVCNETDVDFWYSFGARLFSYSADVWLLRDALKRGLTTIQASIPGGQPD